MGRKQEGKHAAKQRLSKRCELQVKSSRLGDGLHLNIPTNLFGNSRELSRKVLAGI